MFRYTIRSGWNEFVAYPEPDAPPLDLADTDGSITSAELKAARIAFHKRTLNTPTFKQLLDLGSLTIRENEGTEASPRGIALSGPPNVGKSTAVRHLGRTYQRKVGEDSEIPVVYISLPPRVTAKSLALHIARFLELPVKSRDNIDDLTYAVCTTMHEASTRLLLVDEAHNLDWGKAHALEASDQLKHLADTSGATVVAAGVDLINSAVFTGGRAEQTAGRYRAITLGRYGRRSKEWGKLLEEIDRQLCLRNHTPGTLPDLRDYLHDRTRGSLGSLIGLVRQGVIRAIDSGEEQLTRPILDKLTSDIAAEQRRARAT